MKTKIVVLLFVLTELSVFSQVNSFVISDSSEYFIAAKDEQQNVHLIFVRNEYDSNWYYTKLDTNSYCNPIEITGFRRFVDAMTLSETPTDICIKNNRMFITWICRYNDPPTITNKIYITIHPLSDVNDIDTLSVTTENYFLGTDAISTLLLSNENIVITWGSWETPEGEKSIRHLKIITPNGEIVFEDNDINPIDRESHWDLKMIELDNSILATTIFWGEQYSIQIYGALFSLNGTMLKDFFPITFGDLLSAPVTWDLIKSTNKDFCVTWIGRDSIGVNQTNKYYYRWFDEHGNPKDNGNILFEENSEFGFTTLQSSDINNNDNYLFSMLAVSRVAIPNAVENYNYILGEFNNPDDFKLKIESEGFTGHDLNQMKNFLLNRKVISILRGTKIINEDENGNYIGEYRLYANIFNFRGDVSSLIDWESENLSFHSSMNIYPNPANPTAQILYSVGASGYVKLNLYSITGEKILTLVDEFKQTGKYSYNLHSTNLSNGVYIILFESHEQIVAEKIIILK